MLLSASQGEHSAATAAAHDGHCHPTIKPAVQVGNPFPSPLITAIPGAFDERDGPWVTEARSLYTQEYLTTNKYNWTADNERGQANAGCLTVDFQ